MEFPLECPSPKGNYFVPVKCVGGNGNRGFLMSEIEKGSLKPLVKTVRFYFNDADGYVEGMTVTYTDGTESGKRGRVNTATGGSDSNMTEITLKPGETIKQASLWDKRIGGNTVRIGRITLTTVENRSFDIGRKVGLHNEYPVDVGSGYLVGFTGCYGIDLIKLGFIFLKPIEKVVISHVNFTPPPIEEIRSHQLSQSRFTGYGDLHFIFSDKVERVNSYCFTSSTAEQFPKYLRIHAAVPTIVNLNADGALGWGVQKIGWGTQEIKSRQPNKSTTEIFQWSLSGKLNCGEYAICKATCKHGQAEVDYNAQVTVTFAGTNEQWTFSETGTLESSVFDFLTAEAYCN